MLKIFLRTLYDVEKACFDLGLSFTAISNRLDKKSDSRFRLNSASFCVALGSTLLLCAVLLIFFGDLERFTRLLKQLTFTLSS